MAKNISVLKIRALLTRRIYGPVFDFYVAPHLLCIKSALVSDSNENLNNLDTVKYLVSIGADIHVHCNYVFQWAVANGCLDVVKYLVLIGANIRVVDDLDIRRAATKGHHGMAEYLKLLNRQLE